MFFRGDSDILGSVDFKTNVGFFIVLISVIVLALIEGNNMSSSFYLNKAITSSEIQLIAFIILTIFIVTVAIFQPYKISLVAYSAMTLGLVVLITSFFDKTNNFKLITKVIQILLGLILMIAGFFMDQKSKASKEEKKLAVQGLKYYNRK